MDETEFNTAFKALTGNQPFPWQWALYQRFRAGNLPSSCNLPTGLGKTSVVAVWLIALANHPGLMPRRLVYVVNRRTVVDQTTNEVEKLRKNLPNLNSNLGSLALSTLRGQFADNREWSADPSRPAVIVGTVDMIGSRLLFSAYGIGFKSRPLHAGFLGQDVLLVHDEAHLEPAFQKLLIAIQTEQHEGERTGQLPWPKLRVIELSATSRGGCEVFPSDVERNANEEHPVVKKRIKAPKAIHLHENKDEKKLANEIGELALKYKESGRAVLVFVRKVDDVDKIVKKLPKDSFEQLTGTLRGKERDELVKTPRFQRFLPESNRNMGVTPAAGTVYLVCTSAGEVGVNISADHLVCDLSTFDSMAQRFGRVNRFGDRDDTRIDVVYANSFDEKDDYESRLKKTLELLRRSNGNGSPAALGELHRKAMQEASGTGPMSPDCTAALREYILATYAPQPTTLPTSDILFDAWAMTTIREKLPGRPMVEPFLHGIATWEPPETHVAWREEVGFITGDLLGQHKPEDLLEDYPVKPHELLRDRSDRVFKHMVAIAERRPDDPVWLLDDDGTVEVFTLKKLADKDNKERINYRTILLPPAVGGMRDGLMDGVSVKTDDLDVADWWFEDAEKTVPRRKRIRSNDPKPNRIAGMRLIRTIDSKLDEEEEQDSDTPGRYWHWYELPNTGDGDGSKASSMPVLWRVHTCDVVNNAERFIENLPLSNDLKKAISLAAKFHDLGKRRKLWQRSIGHQLPKNPQLDDWLAKSGGKMKLFNFQTDYRHEFGSLLDVLNEDDFKALKDKPELQDLILHLIAVHHGRGRPHFPKNNEVDEAFDPEPTGLKADEIAAEVPRRFARMQRKYGRWGLAYLESLLRAADYAASAKPSEFVEDES